MALPEGITLVDYVDDTAAIIVAPDLDTAQIPLTETMMLSVARWMVEHGLQLAFERKRTYDQTQDIEEATWHRGGTPKHPRHVATMVGGRDKRTVDTQTDSVDMGKT